MSPYVAVVVESDLIQLDRVFDFLVPEEIQDKIEFGQRVSFYLGRAKKLHTGFIVGISDLSEFAKTPIDSIVSLTPVLTPEIYEFSRKVANRQCVAIGEILSAAIPAHMPRIEVPVALPSQSIAIRDEIIHLNQPLSDRSAVLLAAKTVKVGKDLLPAWAVLLAQEAVQVYSQGRSSILAVPEESEVQTLLQALAELGAKDVTLPLKSSGKKSTRYEQFQQILSSESCIVVGTRSAVYAPVRNLGLIALFDDADDSLREQGSPFTHARELAMMRAGNHVRLILAANYRSTEVQRLVEIGYLSDHDSIISPPKISFTPPGSRFDEAAFKLIRERLSSGPVLVLMPRKGSSAAVYCAGCDTKLKCKNCGGPIWEPTSGILTCRLCKATHHSCKECGSTKIRLGRTGSSRTVAELGKVFPNTLIAEASGQKKPSGLKLKNQILVATPSSAPRLSSGYSAVLILDPDVWLSSQSLRAETIAIRDWMEAIELLAPDGRAVISGLDGGLGQALSLGQHRELARAQLRDLTSLGLPPSTRICSLEASSDSIIEAVEICTRLGAKLLRQELGEHSSTLLSFSYSIGPDLAGALRALAIKTNARLVGTNKRRGLRIVMDDARAL